ncbi:MAG: hypothetical protein DRJ68_03600 [Thermoprotei archaeon]|nr:MAG: hypothetical protein DRJ68_03600 [Thermoprotei archaeon]
MDTYRVEDPEAGEVLVEAKRVDGRIHFRAYVYGFKRTWDISLVFEGGGFYEIHVAPRGGRVAKCEVLFAEAYRDDAGEHLNISLVLLAKLSVKATRGLLEVIERVARERLGSPRRIKVSVVAGSLAREVLADMGYEEVDGVYVKELSRE